MCRISGYSVFAGLALATRIAGAQDLVALQRPISANRNCAQSIVGVVEKEAAQTRADTVVKAGAKGDDERDLRDNEENAPVAMMRGAAGPNPDVEQVLLFPLARSGDPPVANSGKILIRLCSHFLGGRAASDSSIMRAQSSG